MSELNIPLLRKKLEEERQILVGELKSLGRPVPGIPGDWMATAPNPDDYSSADKNSAADRVEDLEEKIAAESELEVRLREVMAALNRVSDGSYGICEVGHEPID